MAGIGAYPGTFNPLTTAHLAIAQAARDAFGLERVDLVVSRRPLGKDDLDRPRLQDRLAVLAHAAATRPWLGVKVTDARLLVDVAEGYDVVVMGADKWAQVVDPSWYGSVAERDDAVRRLPRVAVVARPPYDVPEEMLLEVEPWVTEVSSTAVRAGAREWMAQEAAEFDRETGAWSDPDRFDDWLSRSSGTPG